MVRTLNLGLWTGLKIILGVKMQYVEFFTRVKKYS